MQGFYADAIWLHDNDFKVELLLSTVLLLLLPSTPHVKLKVGDTECPQQVCQLSRSSESTHFRSFVEI